MLTEPHVWKPLVAPLVSYCTTVSYLTDHEEA